MARRSSQGRAVNESASLIATPDAPVPEGGAAEWFTGADGARLRAALFPAKGRLRGSVVLSPGRTEALEKYFEVIGELQGRGFVVLIHDWRGQGLSARALPDRMKGHAVGWQPFLSDYKRLLDIFEARLPKPWIQMAHSMGGCLSLLALAKGEDRFVASALSAPMFGIVASDHKLHLARALAFAASGVGLSSQYLFGNPADPFKLTFEKDRITHDRFRWNRTQAQINACPDLALGNLTWGWLNFAFAATAFLRHDLAVTRVKIPVLIVAAGDDDRVLTADTAKVAARLPHCTYIEIPNSYHEVLMETDDIRSQWWAAFDVLADGAVNR
jgi:lysophospholipase